MYSYFSDLHVQLLSQGLLQPGEKLVGQSVMVHRPWWMPPVFAKTFLALATEQRLILVEHRLAFFFQALKVTAVESIPWSNVQETRIKGLFTKKVRLHAQTSTGSKRMDMTVPNALFGLLAPMRNNMQGAKNVVGAFQATRQLGAGQMLQSLPPASYGPPPQAYGPPSQGQFAPPSQQFAPPSQPPFPPSPSQSPFAAHSAPFAATAFAPAPPPQQQHQHPAINAQGYTSVPPAPPAPPRAGIPPRAQQAFAATTVSAPPPSYPPRSYPQS